MLFDSASALRAECAPYEDFLTGHLVFLSTLAGLDTAGSGGDRDGILHCAYR